MNNNDKMGEKNLETFRVLHIVHSVLIFMFSLFPLMYFFIGEFVQDIHAQNPDAEQLPFNPFIIFKIIGIVGFVLVLAFGVLNILCASYIKNRKRYTFIFVVSILNCLTGMLGILLGVFTLVELTKPEVKKVFGKV